VRKDFFVPISWFNMPVSLAINNDRAPKKGFPLLWMVINHPPVKHESQNSLQGQGLASDEVQAVLLSSWAMGPQIFDCKSK
jgi:hypothetical protein